MKSLSLAAVVLLSTAPALVAAGDGVSEEFASLLAARTSYSWPASVEILPESAYQPTSCKVLGATAVGAVRVNRTRETFLRPLGSGSEAAATCEVQLASGGWARIEREYGFLDT